MARSTTSFSPKWRSGPTTVVRVPQAISAEVLEFARGLDEQFEAGVAEPTAGYRTARDFDPERPVNVAAVPHLSPFRYPGGKTWFVPHLRAWLCRRRPRILVEPFAGGGIIGLTAVAEGLVEHLVLVEKDENVSSVWRTILSGQSDWLVERILSFTLTEEAVRETLARDPVGQRERAFQTILRNRVQRGGIMAKGAGLVKVGENGRGISSRWYPETLARRIQRIAELGDRIAFIEGDAFKAIADFSDDETACMFIDPPYTVAAKRLYTHWSVDHANLFSRLKAGKNDFIMTYDDAQEIRLLATMNCFETGFVAMKNTHHAQMRELIIGRSLAWLREAQVFAGSRDQTHQESLEFPL